MEGKYNYTAWWIIMIVIVGAYLYFAFMAPAAQKREAKERQDAQVAKCDQNAKQYALDSTKGFENNPYLSDPDQIRIAQNDFYADYLKECFKTVSFIEEK